MSYGTSSIISPNTEHHKATAELGSVKYGNMMSEHARSTMRSDAQARIAEQHPDAGYYTQSLNVFFHGKKRGAENGISSNHKKNENDGYDERRIMLNIGMDLDDPAPDIASAYDFAENGATLFFGHFKADKPVNNSKGFQAAFFDETGNITFFAVVDKKGQVKTYALDDEVPASVNTALENIGDVTAPSRKTVYENLMAAQPSLQKSLANDYANE